MSILKESTRTLEYKPEEMKKLIAQDLEVDPSRIDVKYVLTEVGGDPLDRFPGHKEVTSTRVIVKES